LLAEAQQNVAEKVKFLPGFYAQWSGQFEYLQRAEARLRIVVPVTLADDSRDWRIDPDISY